MESNADCLVNTVNCEGFMGKGIAYQFKLQYPNNNNDYVEACKNGTFGIGKLHVFSEKGKIIINFPTKDKWRAKSKIEFIEKGLIALVKIIPELKISSIAIPPLGCGNGGLSWFEVKQLLMKYLQPLANTLDIEIYEPSKGSFKSKVAEPPKISASHLILMEYKPRLKKFSRLRIQKTGFFMNIFSNTEYFKFEKHKFGPHAHSIDVLIKEIKQFQEFYKVSTEEARKLANTMLISERIDRKLISFSDSITMATEFVNDIGSDWELELISSVCVIVKEKKDINQYEIISEFKNWSVEKAEKFTEQDIISAINRLTEKRIIQINLMGNYYLTEYKRTFKLSCNW
ncbi:hypothetical protein DCMF_07055 [Candidatus Formimonas warabiya]|uniref:Macro domain-containing protein n=1 Tax=Formimonas warabiya TaxID=1761012 RepID=A0A3G1L0X2_FORW1|nr:hypothetical protein DCMF_07055 [Candidatus Formimonas warabiya]